MADEPRLPDPDEVPRAVPREAGPRLLQPIWIIPVVAVLIAGWIAVKHFLEQGPTITIQFQSATAVKNGQQVTIAQAGGTPITMIDRTDQTLATPSALGADGASFSVQRSAVVPTTPAPTTPRRSRPTPTPQVTQSLLPAA